MLELRPGAMAGTRHAQPRFLEMIEVPRRSR
jgi:hypothetical protein